MTSDFTPDTTALALGEGSPDACTDFAAAMAADPVLAAECADVRSAADALRTALASAPARSLTPGQRIAVLQPTLTSRAARSVPAPVSRRRAWLLPFATAAGIAAAITLAYVLPGPDAGQTARQPGSRSAPPDTIALTPGKSGENPAAPPIPPPAVVKGLPVPGADSLPGGSSIPDGGPVPPNAIVTGPPKIVLPPQAPQESAAPRPRPVRPPAGSLAAPAPR